jgi:hypothetical protein
LHTDDAGLAHADFGVPRFTGKLRLMVVAAHEAQFGSGQAATLVRSPLLVQSSWPRFAAPGDKFLVPLTVFNNTTVEMDAAVQLHVADGPLRFGASADATLPGIKLPANGQATEFVEVTASADSGVSHATLVASAGNETYEEDVEIPVRPANPEIQLGGYAIATPEKPAEISLPGGMLWLGAIRDQGHSVAFPGASARARLSGALPVRLSRTDDQHSLPTGLSQ